MYYDVLNPDLKVVIPAMIVVGILLFALYKWLDNKNK